MLAAPWNNRRAWARIATIVRPVFVSEVLWRGWLTAHLLDKYLNERGHYLSEVDQPGLREFHDLAVELLPDGAWDLGPTREPAAA